MRPSVRKQILICAALLTLASVNQGCSGGFTKINNRDSVTSSSILVPGANGTMVPANATKTTAVSHAGNLLDHVTAMHGLGTPSAAARTGYNDNRLRVSETGKVDSVTAPMWLAITNVSGRSCTDLVNKEAALADAQRTFFVGVNFAGGPDALKASPATIDRTINKLARAVWARDEEVAERDLIRSAAMAQFSGTNTTQLRYMVRYICSAMTASLDAHDR